MFLSNLIHIFWTAAETFLLITFPFIGWIIVTASIYFTLAHFKGYDWVDENFLPDEWHNSVFCFFNLIFFFLIEVSWFITYHPHL